MILTTNSEALLTSNSRPFRFFILNKNPIFPKKCNGFVFTTQEIPSIIAINYLVIILLRKF